MMKVMGIAIAIMTLLLAGSGWVIKNQIETIKELEIQYELQREETAKANATIDEQQRQHEQQLADMRDFMEDQRNEITELRSRTVKLRSTQDSLTRALTEQPVRAGRTTTILDARSLRDICRASGGSPAECRITLPEPSSPSPGDSAAD